MEFSEIKENISSSDQKIIAKTTGYSIETVRKVMAGTRNNTLIWEAAKIIAKGKKSLEEQILIMLEA